LKPSFNKSGENSFQRRKSAAKRQKPRRKQRVRVMATLASASFSPPTAHDGRSSPVSELKMFWRQFFARAFDPYRPELHYMRGPGPAWRAKHGAEALFRLNRSGDL
jgi:hypothetical protein